MPAEVQLQPRISRKLPSRPAPPKPPSNPATIPLAESNMTVAVKDISNDIVKTAKHSLVVPQTLYKKGPLSQKEN